MAGRFGDLASSHSPTLPAITEVGTDAALSSWIDSHTSGPQAPELLVVVRAPTEISGPLEKYPRLHRDISESASATYIPFAPPVSWNQWHGEHHKLLSWENVDDLMVSFTKSKANQGSKRSRIIVLDGLPAEDFDEQFASLRTKAEQEAGDGKCAFAFISTDSIKESANYIKAMTEPVRRMTASSSSDAIAYVHMTPDLLAGILTGLLLVIIAMIGLTCLSSIQTPSQFSDKPPPSAREY